MLKLNYDFINQVKYIKHNHLIILLYLYSWIESKNCPVAKTFENDERIYFWVSIDKIAKDLLLTRTQVQNALYRLENKDKRIESTLQPFIYPKQNKKENQIVELSFVNYSYMISLYSLVIKEKGRSKRI